MRILNLAVAALVLSAPTQAAEYDIALRADIAPRCMVTEIVPVNLRQGRLMVRASCNADQFRLLLGGDLAPFQPRLATSDQGKARLFGSEVVIAARKPGEFRVQLHFDRDLGDIRDVTAHIEGY